MILFVKFLACFLPLGTSFQSHEQPETNLLVQAILFSLTHCCAIRIRISRTFQLPPRESHLSLMKRIECRTP
ncbi:hypothetical protein BJ875DRAFT_474949 [Amylocarpus encephaloides]|uniref:Secreted protein n=1 Tax=Amylocarpus encephaloides TaxID=45428 RepID=A0A9P7YA32_9HELO|nr:hypothetical protein BJ875DRAFT_474949 [Amylocarpus encephaloides]